MTDTTDPQTAEPLRIPIAHSVCYAARGLPEVPNKYGPGVLAPSEITLTYRAAPDSGLGRVHAYVAGRIWVDGAQIPLLPSGLYGQHYDDGLDGWPEWLAEEARLHDPDADRAAVLDEAADDEGDELVCVDECGLCDACGMEPFGTPAEGWREAARFLRRTARESGDRQGALHGARLIEAELRRLADETQQDGPSERNFAAYQAAIFRVALILREARKHREQTDPSERQDCVMCGADHFAEIRDAIKGKQPASGARQDGAQQQETTRG